VACTLRTPPALALAALVCINACGPSGPSAPGGGELVASMRSEPATYNRYLRNGAGAPVEVVTLLTQARLVRVNRVTDEVEPWLAEGWTAAADGVTYTVTLRPGVKFSDGQPLTSADVAFSFRLAYDDAVKSGIGQTLQVNGKPLQVAVVDDRTVTVKLPEPFAPGLRLLEHLPIVPKHKLEAALGAGTIGEAWAPSCSPSTRPASASCSTATRITSAATPPACSCRISTASPSPSFPSRRRKRCGSRRGRST
jgi:ABC-type transport system substrate-binding protein